MKSKISYFNKTIFKKNMTHFWPLWAFYFCLLLYLLPLSLWLNTQSYRTWESYTSSQIQQMVIWQTFEWAMNPLFTFLFAIFAVMATFSYLYSAKSTNMMHALPVNRLELFVTNFISAAAFMILPQLIIFVISIFSCMALHITNLEYILFWLGATTGITFFALALGVFVAMFTGQLIALPCYYFIINFLYVGCSYLITILIQACCFGVVDAWNPGKTCILSPIYYLNNNLRLKRAYDENYELTGISLTGGHLVLVYMIAGIFLLVAAYHLYRRRQLETAGDLITMNWIKPIFRCGAGICFGIAGGILIANTVRYRNSYKGKDDILLLVMILLVELIVFFVSEMLIQKNFRVFRKKRIAEWAVLAAFTGIVVGMFEFDVFGIEGMIPEASDVDMAVTNFDYTIQYKGEDIADVIRIQKEILDRKEELVADGKTMFLNIAYYMKDGSVITRSYPVMVDYDSVYNEDTIVSKLIAVETDPDHLMSYIFGTNYKTNEYYAGNIRFYDESGREDEYRFTEDEMKDIIDAIICDLKEGNINKYELYSLMAYDEDFYKQQYDSTITINYYNPDGIHWTDMDYTYEELPAEDGIWKETTSYYDTNGSAYLNFGADCTNIVNTLKKLGIVNEERQLRTYAGYPTHAE